MQKKTKKILLIIIAAIVMITIAFAVLIKIYITPKNIKAFLIPKAEKTLNRRINIGEVDISLFKGIEVKDLIIKEADEKTDFVKCKDFVLKYKLLPLLYKKVIINELKLASLEIRITRNRESKFNFEGIGQKKEAPKVKEEKNATEQKKAPISLLVNSIVVENARFSLLDLKKELPNIKGAIDIDMEIKSAAKSELFSKGNIDLKLDEIVIKKPSEKRIKNINVALRYTAYINPESNDIRIDKANLKIQEVPFSITGEIKNFKISSELNIAVSLPETKTSDIQKSLSSFFNTKGLTLSGYLTADLKLTGAPRKPDSLKTSGIVMLKKAGIAYNNMNTVLDGNLKLKGQSMDIDLKGTTGKNTVNIKGSIISYFKNPEIKLNLYSSVPGGLDEVVNSFFPRAKDTVSGMLSFNLKLNSTGKSSESIKRNLIADGDFNIKDGKIVNKMTENLSLFLGIDELKTINLKQAQGTVRIRNEIIRLESILTSDDISMDPSGNIGLDETLDLVFDLKFSPRLTDMALKNPNIASYIKDEEGWGRIPLKVSGTFANPSYSVDIAKAGKRVIKKKVKELLDDLFKKDENVQNEKEDQKPDIKKPIEDLFKGLFK